MALRSHIEQLASQFVTSILAAMRNASLEDLAEQASGASASTAAAGRRGPVGSTAVEGVGKAVAKRGRRRRASAQEVNRQKNLALSVARQLKGGFSKGQLMANAASRVDLGRALSLLVADGKLNKKGDRRLTRYWVK